MINTGCMANGLAGAGTFEKKFLSYGLNKNRQMPIIDYIK